MFAKSFKVYQRDEVNKRYVLQILAKYRQFYVGAIESRLTNVIYR